MAFSSRKSLGGRDSRATALWLLSMSREEYSAAFKGSPMKRAKLRGLKRNAAVVLGNTGAPGDVPALLSALSDEEPLVRGHAAWALGRLGMVSELPALDARLSTEADEWVLDELSSAVASIVARSSPSKSK